MMAGLPLPVRTASKIDTPGRFDYSPSVAAGRIWWTGQYRGDALFSCALSGALRFNYWTDPTALVADPAAVWTGDGWLVFFTRGVKGGPNDGRMNGICVAEFDAQGRGAHPAQVAPARYRTIIPPSTNPDTYGNGQPSVAALPGNRYHLVYRADGTYGSELRSAMIDSTTLDVLGDVPFTEHEDGASPEAFYLDGVLHVLLVGVDAEGNGWAGIRRYISDRWPISVVPPVWGGGLARDRAAEIAHPIRGGSFWALPGAVPISNGIDGAGIVRDRNNDPVIRNGRLTVWRGWRNSLTRSPDWKLVKFTIPLP